MKRSLKPVDLRELKNKVRPLAKEIAYLFANHGKSPWANRKIEVLLEDLNEIYADAGYLADYDVVFTDSGKSVELYDMLFDEKVARFVFPISYLKRASH